MTGFEHEFVKISNDEKEDYKTNVYAAGVFPYLKDETTGEGLGESVAIARFMCNSKQEAGLYGSSAYEAAKIDEVVDRNIATFNGVAMKFLYAVLGYGESTKEDFAEHSKKFKDYLRLLDEHLKDREYFVGDKLSLADVYLATSFNLLFATYIDAGFRKAVPNLTKWYGGVRTHAVIEHHLGKARYCGKAFKPKLSK